jgi:hypothetical protein
MIYSIAMSLLGLAIGWELTCWLTVELRAWRLRRKW